LLNMIGIGVVLPSVDEQRAQGLDLRAAARHAEQAGLDSIWMGDHLAVGMPTIEATVGLATAAAVTERVRIGLSVFVPAIRPLAWAAKQLASLQYVASGRLILGVGSGGGEGQWAAAGMAFAERGKRTDVAMRALPDLLAGKPVRLDDEPGQPVVELAPAVDIPPFWVGNDSAVARRRAARLGDGWFPSLIPVDEVRSGRAHLADLTTAYGRSMPTTTIGGAAVLGGTTAEVDDVARMLSHGYGMPFARAQGLLLGGSLTQAAERLSAYAEAGASHAVLGLSGNDWRGQVDLLAQVRTELR
jgi:alkanesulfonate monooxygenase SsuD/methylene tetrahydromethanopterin reductase-like flavin-dependent oxidoreductase (luciferase family)